MQNARSVKNGGARGVELTAVVYTQFAPYVRGQLAEFGVCEADLPALCDEVFLVVQDKAHVVAAIDRLDLWLRAICRRVAAGYRPRSAPRRRAQRARWCSAPRYGRPPTVSSVIAGLPPLAARTSKRT
jgi:hypothetical protein